MKAGYRDWDDFLRRVKEEVSCAEVAARWGGIQLHPAGTGSMILCPFHGERTPSCHLDGPLFHCFGAGCGAAGDVLTFTRRISGAGFIDTALALAAEFGLPVPDLDSTGRGRTAHAQHSATAPAGAARLTGRASPAREGPASWPVGLPPAEPDLSGGDMMLWFRNSGFRRHRPSSWHGYRDPEGRLVALTARTEHSGGKTVLPVTWRINPANGWGCWTCGGFSGASTPVYGRERLSAFRDSDAAILIVDGEKTADAGDRLLSPIGWAVLSAMGGCKAGHRADWTDVAGLVGRPGRRTAIVVWPDLDRPQRNQPDPAGATADRLLSAVAASCGSIGNLLAGADCRLVRLAGSRRHGWALDDAEAEGLTADWAATQLGQAVSWSGTCAPSLPVSAP